MANIPQGLLQIILVKIFQAYIWELILAPSNNFINFEADDITFFLNGNHYIQTTRKFFQQPPSTFAH